MDFPTACPHCGHTNRVDYADSAIHDVTCAACGGRACVLVRKQTFEVLFDLGTRALMAGYAREAVSSFSAALERFFEFYVRATTLERAAGEARDFGDVLAALDGTWRHVASQSERQLGMVALAYLLREGRAPDFLTPAALGSDFRNRVIHRGALPARADVEAYAAGVFALIDRLLTELGSAAAHAELAQELRFAAHVATLPDGVPAVFEEHPGMFRARRFGAPPADKPNLPPQGGPMNDARAAAQTLFRRALAERGPALERFKGR